MEWRYRLEVKDKNGVEFHAITTYAKFNSALRRAKRYIREGALQVDIKPRGLAIFKSEIVTLIK